MISREVESDLQNWARYSNAGSDGGPPIQRQAGSAEGRHIPDDGLIWETHQDKPIPINTDRARMVQNVYDTRLSSPERKVLQAQYPHQHRYMRDGKSGRFFDRAKAARTLGIPLRIYGEMLSRAARFVGEALDLRK